MKGLKVLSTQTWYGSGYCGICGNKEHLIPQSVRYWDPDDGWRIGVLCGLCTKDVQDRRPAPEDYAYFLVEKSKEYDALAEVNPDLDFLYSDLQ